MVVDTGMGDIGAEYVTCALMSNEKILVRNLEGQFLLFVILNLHS